MDAGARSRRPGHHAHGPRAPRDPRLGYQSIRAEPRGCGRLLAGGGRRRVPRRRRARVMHGVRTRLLRRVPARPGRNSVEAVHASASALRLDGLLDHLWIHVADLPASKRFYATIASHTGIRLGDDEPGRAHFRGEDYSFSLIDDERPLTEHVHLAFAAREDATVRAFHAAALAAGYEDHGGPGERAVPPRLLRRVRPGPRRAQRRSRQPQPPTGLPPPRGPAGFRTPGGR